MNNFWQSFDGWQIWYNWIWKTVTLKRTKISCACICYLLFSCKNYCLSNLVKFPVSYSLWVLILMPSETDVSYKCIGWIGIKWSPGGVKYRTAYAVNDNIYQILHYTQVVLQMPIKFTKEVANWPPITNWCRSSTADLLNPNSGCKFSIQRCSITKKFRTLSY